MNERGCMFKHVGQPSQSAGAGGRPKEVQAEPVVIMAMGRNVRRRVTARHGDGVLPATRIHKALAVGGISSTSNQWAWEAMRAFVVGFQLPGSPH